MEHGLSRMTSILSRRDYNSKDMGQELHRMQLRRDYNLKDVKRELNMRMRIRPEMDYNPKNVDW